MRDPESIGKKDDVEASGRRRCHSQCLSKKRGLLLAGSENWIGKDPVNPEGFAMVAYFS